MTTSEKLQIIMQLSGQTQEALAKRLDVSFVSFNRWINGRAQPHQKALNRIEALYRQLTGQKQWPDSALLAKKSIIRQKSVKIKNIVTLINTRPDLRDEFALSLTYNTNRIEGSTVTRDETAAILFDRAVLRRRTLTEQLEVKNHQSAWLYLLNYLQDRQPISEALILKMHAILMNSVHEEAGQYRRHGVRIVGANVPTANHLSIVRLMGQLVPDMNKKRSDTVSLMADIHARFEQIHPFADANGRVGRLLLQAMLMKRNFPPAIIKQQDRRQYMKSLKRAQVTDDMTLLEDFLSDAILSGFALLESPHPPVPTLIYKKSTL